MTLLHITDPHFNFVSDATIRAFGAHVRAEAKRVNAQAVVITGDISEAPRLAHDLATFRSVLGVGLGPFFVLGSAA